MSAAGRGEDVVAALGRRGHRVVEIYLKRGRSRRVGLEVGRLSVVSAREEGWAVRAGDGDRAFLAGGTGAPSPDGPWPEPRPPGLRLAAPVTGSPWRPPDDLDLPVMGEAEGQALLEDLASRLAGELPGAQVLQARLEEGVAEVSIASSRGVAARFRTRAASLYAEAVRGGGRPVRAALQVAVRALRDIDVRAEAARLGDRLRLREAPPESLRDRGELLLGPEVGAALLAGLLPLWVGAGAEERLRPLLDRRGRLGSALWTLVDDGRLPSGVLAAPADGEGTPTRAVTLVEEGAFRQPLVSWREARPPERVASGCVVRPGWRDVPARGPTHLYQTPDPEVSVSDLLGEIARGYYLIEAGAGGRFDLEGDAFELPVEGMRLARGRAVAPVTGALLRGRVSSLLRGLRGVGRDVRFASHGGGMIGSPTLLVSGLEIVSP